jgi:glycosidase
VIWHKAASDVASVEIVGDFNAWKRPGRMLEAERPDGWRATSIDFGAGEHAYAIVEDGVWLSDPNVPTTAYHDGHEVTWIDVASCDVPGIEVTGAAGSADGHATVEAKLLASRAPRNALDPASITATTAEGRAFSVTRADAATGAIAIAAEGLPAGKHVVTLRARDAAGRNADEALATVWIEPRAIELRDLVVYQIVVDRYRGDTGALHAPSLPSGRAGGTIGGVRRAIESGEIGALGANALWLSPLYANAEGTWPGGDGRPYTSYHGYWPTEARALAPEQGTDADLDALVTAAHARGIRVIFDVVPNHVHQDHPYFKDHPEYFHGIGAGCVCGSATCGWADHIEECWFTPYLPDVDWTSVAAADAMTADVRWWMDRFSGDGVRIDAVPMMPRSATRRIAQAIRTRHDHPGHASLLLGENYTGPGGYGQLRYDLGPGSLDSEFHFPLMWALRSAVANATGTMRDVDAAIHDGDAAWDGSGAVMATMLGNHDVTRFASESAGDADGDGWAPAAQPLDPLVYAKQAMALATVMTLPGMPVVYYGDEVALAGRSDPDSRRVLPAEADLNDMQRALRGGVRLLGRLRACSDALRRGAYRTLAATDEALVYAREIDGAPPVVVALTRLPDADLSVPLTGISAGPWVDVLTGRSTSLSPELTNLGRAPFSVRVLVPAASACVAP